MRISFQRANPTFGNFGFNKKSAVHLPGCLERMLEDEVLPRARRDESTIFRTTVMEEASVIKIFEEYEPMLKAYYNRVTQQDTGTLIVRTRWEWSNGCVSAVSWILLADGSA